MLWDRPATVRNPGEDATPPGLALFHSDGEVDEFDFAPLWSMDALVNTKSGVAAFVGADDSLSLNESLRCYDIITGEMLFSFEGTWIPLGFIEDGWSLVAMEAETRWKPIHGKADRRALENFTGEGYSLKYSVHIIDVLSGEKTSTIVVFDTVSRKIRWEDRFDFKPQLAVDAGLLFAALPEFPYITDEIDADERPVKLWALDVRGEVSMPIDVGDAIRDRNFSFIVSSDGRSVFFQSQRESETVSMKMPFYGGAEREWGDLCAWRDGEITLIAELDGKHVRQQMGICRRGKTLLCAEIEYDEETRYPVEGTLSFFLTDLPAPNRRDLAIEGEIWSVSMSQGGRWIAYTAAVDGLLRTHLLDTIRGEDNILVECGLRSRFYGFAGADHADIIMPYMNAALFGIGPTESNQPPEGASLL